MILSAELTFPSKAVYQVEIHEIESDSMGRIHKGKFKNTPSLSAQLDKEAQLAGSWRAIKEMSIQMEYRGSNYKLPILVDVPVQEFGLFQVIGDNEA